MLLESLTSVGTSQWIAFQFPPNFTPLYTKEILLF